ncbi:MAG TPA: heme o synthase [Herpetosiphonaceae bacterium]
MSETHESPLETTAAAERTPARRRDTFRLIASLTALVAVALPLNLLPAAPAVAPVALAWTLATLLLIAWSYAGRERGQHQPINWLALALNPAGIGLIVAANAAPTPTLRALHLALAGLTALGALALALLAWRSRPSAALPKPPTKWSDYRMLMKFRIISLLLLTTLIPMYLVKGAWPPISVILATLLGGTLAAGGANAINMYLDQDIDAVMSRTKRRPLPGNRLSGREVLGFGLGVSLASFVVLAVWVNRLSAFLATAGIFYYVVIYTRWLKRTTVQNIVIGGAAGAIPPLVGWAAVSNSVTLPAIFLFAIVFYWTPPHFWALAIIRRDDYAKAGVPMLPVVKGEAETRRQIVLYTLIMLALTLMLAVVPGGGLGAIYLGSAAILGGLFLYYAVKMLSDTSHGAAWRLYKYSLLYLALLFVAMGLDRAILG